jgi:hypothetical protein
MSHNAKEPVRQETMMLPMDFADVGSNMAALFHGVMQTTLRTILEYSRAESPQALVALQHRFAREYLAALQQGVMTLVSTLRPGAK